MHGRRRLPLRGLILATLAVLVASIGGWALLRGGPGRDPCPSRADFDDFPAPTLQAARRGDFSVQDRPAVRLVPPVDWKQNPYGSKPWRRQLHSMSILDPLFTLYKRDRDVAALRRARDLMLDWAARNPVEDDPEWKQKIAGERAARLGYLTAAAACAGILSDAQRDRLRDSAGTHGDFLADTENYRAGNHGTAMDLGLLVLTGHLPSLPHAEEWRQQAQRRFAERAPVHPIEAVTLEHSPSYQFTVLGQIEEFIEQAGGDRGLVGLRDRMRAAAPWLVMPDATVTRLGDSGRTVKGEFTGSPPSAYTGIAPTLRSGFGIVKVPARGAYLSVAAGHHPYGHKQADELTFELYDRGRHIVTDTGRYGALRDRRDPAKSAQHDFTLSSWAHSVLLVDGRSFQYEDREPHGSALTATGSGDGWYAIEGTNPLLRGVGHRRLFLYRPGEALVVVDRVRAASDHRYTRLFQFDPGISVTPNADTGRIALRGGGFDGALLEASGPEKSSTRVVTGRRRPPLGFTTPADRFAPMIPRSVVVQESRGDSMDFATLIALRGTGSVNLREASDAGVKVRLALGAGQAIELHANRRGKRIEILEIRPSGAR